MNLQLSSSSTEAQLILATCDNLLSTQLLLLIQIQGGKGQIILKS